MSRFIFHIPTRYWVEAVKGRACSFPAPNRATRLRCWAAVISAEAIALLASRMMDGVGAPLVLLVLTTPPAALLFAFEFRKFRILKIAIANMWQGLAFYDADGRLVLYNGRFCGMLGLSPDDMRRAKSHRDVVALSCEAGNHEGASVEEACRAEAELVARRQATLAYVNVSGNRTLAVSHEPLEDGGWIRTYADVTSRRQVEARVIHMAHHDVLTDLPNRLLFHETLERALRTASAATPLALMFLDLDRFKAVNDTLGHAVGDRLLQLVADRLRRAVRPDDLVARLGGDEFAIIQTGAEGTTRIGELAKRLVASLGDVYEIEGTPVSVGVSIGVTFAPADGAGTDVLLRNADVALYRAKSSGRGGYCFFTAGMEAQMKRRRVLEAELRVALLCEQFEVHYQPLVSLKSLQIVSFEALLRWRHPIHGMISPDEFIPIAEETGLIIDLGAWVLYRACRTAAEWPADVKLAVNVSPTQFRGEQLVSDVLEALANSGLKGYRLEIEVTETVMMQENDATLMALHQLASAGVGVSMDDFGTGHSSLSSLSRFPFHTIKIDRSFITDITSRRESLAIVRAVTQLGRSLGMQVTAEGIETHEQLAEVTAQGCTLGQGYLLGRPMPAGAIAEFLDRWDARAYSDRNYA